MIVAITSKQLYFEVKRYFEKRFAPFWGISVYHEV